MKYLWLHSVVVQILDENAISINLSNISEET